MDGPRPPKESELDHLFNFLSTELRPKCEWSISDEYPLAMTPANIKNLRIIESQGEILAHALIRPLMIKSVLGIYKVAAIGSVVTHPKHRNKGLSQQILEECLKSSEQQGCDLAILWTDLFDFYRKIGFELAGTEVSAIFDQPFDAGPADFTVKEGPNVAPEALLKLFTKHTVGTIRTPSEVQENLKIPNSRIYTAWNNKNEIRAYAIEGKGADLKGYLHEWGGDVNNLLKLIAHIRRVQETPVTVICPAHSENLIKKMEQSGAMVNRGFLGMMKILNPGNLFGKINRYARTLGIEDLTFDYRSDKYMIGFKNETFVTDDQKDIVRLVFGPSQPRELYKFDEATNSALEAIFPLPMWIWGWDSV